MNRSRARLSSLLAALVLAVLSCALAAKAQERTAPLWFQGTRLVFDHAIPMQGDLAVSTRDGGLRRFLDKLGATVAFQPQQRYVVITAADRRTMTFTLGDPSYIAGGVRAQAAFAPIADGNDAVVPFFAVARGLYVEAIPDGAETVLQPRVGALDVRTDGPRTILTIRAAMPLLATTNAETPEHVQVSFLGQGSSLTPARRVPGTALDSVGVAVSGSTRVPTTTLTIEGVRGMSHRVVPGLTPNTYSVVFEPGGGTVGANVPPPPPPLPPGTPMPVPPDVTEPVASPTAAPPIVAGRATVTNVTIEPGAEDALAVRIALSGAVKYEWHRLLDQRWYLDLANTTLSGPGRDERPQFGAVEAVRVRQIGTSDAPVVRIAFTLTGDQQVDIAPNDAGVVLTVGNAQSTDAGRIGYGQTGGAPVVGSAASPEPGPSDAPWKFGPNPGSRVIVIDPGHGGGDTGTQHNGLVEKDLTLDIAQRLRTLLAAQGWTVRMTRESDVDPVSTENLVKMRADGKPNADDRAYLQTRCDVANSANARLFISIHVNSAPYASAHGTTVYWYKTQDAPFAQAIERNLIPLAGTQDDGVRHENFYVVRHATMPAVLIETAFVTNPGDVALLRQPSFLPNVAQGIANGVKAYAGSPSANSLSER